LCMRIEQYGNLTIDLSCSSAYLWGVDPKPAVSCVLGTYLPLRSRFRAIFPKLCLEIKKNPIHKKVEGITLARWRLLSDGGRHKEYGLS
jgi:hypothetical protein